MKNTSNIDEQTLVQLLSDSQNARDISAQAMRLLQLLEARYAWLGLGESDWYAQYQLHYYITWSKKSLYEKSFKPVMMQINGQAHPVARLISIMLTLDLELSQKEKLLMQIEKLISKYPGSSTWTPENNGWPSHGAYNRPGKLIRYDPPSPARTLLLVCAAILDNAHHADQCVIDPALPSSSSFVQTPTQDHDIVRVQRMAQAMADTLLGLEHLDCKKCSGGEQHELLWLLQGSYLDAEQKPCVWIGVKPEDEARSSITPFFQEMKNNPHAFMAYWAHIQALPGLQLSDENIQQILKQIIARLSVYDINRLLLHGLHVAPRLWSVIYKQTLASICRWLLSFKPSDDSLARKAIKESYPTHLLTNLLLQTLLPDELRGLLSVKQDAPRLLFENMLMQYCHLVSTLYRSQLFTAINPYYDVLIQDVNQLSMLLLFGPERYDASQFTEYEQFWNAIKSNLPLIIQNGYQLRTLLMLDLGPYTRLRVTLLSVLKTRLSLIIQDAAQLKGLLGLSLEQFNSEQRTELLDVLKASPLASTSVVEYGFFAETGQRHASDLKSHDYKSCP